MRPFSSRNFDFFVDSSPPVAPIPIFSASPVYHIIRSSIQQPAMKRLNRRKANRKKVETLYMFVFTKILMCLTLKNIKFVKAQKNTLFWLRSPENKSFLAIVLHNLVNTLPKLNANNTFVWDPGGQVIRCLRAR